MKDQVRRLQSYNYCDQEVKGSILQGMPSLQGNLIQLHFSNRWPQCLDLPALSNKVIDEKDDKIQLKNLNEVFFLARKKRHRDQFGFELKQIMKVSKCPHTQSRHYAKNMCSACYHRKKKEEKQIVCGHNERTVFARGMCSSCYYRLYQGYRKEKDS